MRVTDANRLEFLDLDIVYSGADDVIVARTDGALKPGMRIALTPLPFAADGDQVTVEGEAPQGPPGGKGPWAQGKGDGEQPKRPERPKT